jgi:outer membrane protein TolC
MLSWLVPALAGASLAAQSTPRLTLAEVYSGLDPSQPQIAAARARANAATARIGPVSRWPDPTIQLALMNRNLPGLGLQDPLGMNQIQVMQMIPVAGKTGLAVRAARAEAAAGSAEAEDAAWSVRASAAMSFYDLLQTDGALETMTGARRLLEDLARNAASMYGAGRGRQTDALRAQVELARMDEELIRMGAMRDAMRVRLNAIRGLPTDAPVAPPVPPRLPDSLPSPDSLERLALGHRPMLAAGVSRVEAAKALSRRAGREIWPDLTLGVIYGQRRMPDGGADRMASFMLGFSLPLSPGRRQGQMRAEADAMTAMAVAELEDLRIETRTRIGELTADLGRARRLDRLYRTILLPQLRATAAAALAGYRGGSVDFMSLLDSQMAVIRASVELFRFGADSGKAIAELEMLTATPLLDPASQADNSGDTP